MSKIRLLVDMDGVITDFNKSIWDIYEKNYPDVAEKYPRPVFEEMPFYAESAYENQQFKDTMRKINTSKGFFKNLPPIEGAIDALHDLEQDFQVFICTAPLLLNPTCCDDKMWWVRKHLGEEWKRRTIITKDKTVVDGDFLIDDKPEITGIQDPIWRRIVFDRPYNKNTVGRRLDWQNYREVLRRIW